MTNEDEEIYNNSQICWICKEELKTYKVKDHCHVNGKFRGAAHNKCNLKLRIRRKLPIIFHNLQGYEGHIIFKELNNFDVDISVIPKGTDKYMSKLPPKECFYSSVNHGKRNKVSGHISGEQYYMYKMFGIHLILTISKIFMIIILKKIYYYQLICLKNLFILT